MLNIANGNRSKVNATNKFQFKQINNQNEIDQNIIFNFRTSLETLEQLPFKSKQTYWVLNKENIIVLCNSLYPSGYSIDYDQLPNGTMNYILKPKKSLYTTF